MCTRHQYSYFCGLNISAKNTKKTVAKVQKIIYKLSKMYKKRHVLAAQSNYAADHNVLVMSAESTIRDIKKKLNFDVLTPKNY